MQDATCENRCEIWHPLTETGVFDVGTVHCCYYGDGDGCWNYAFVDPTGTCTWLRNAALFMLDGFKIETREDGSYKCDHGRRVVVSDGEFWPMMEGGREVSTLCAVPIDAKRLVEAILAKPLSKGATKSALRQRAQKVAGRFWWRTTNAASRLV